MGFVGVARAVYDYTPRGDDELHIREDDLLLIIHNDHGDGWIKAKKKASQDYQDEPEGLAPANYVEVADVIGSAKALYDYSRQTDEEISFAEEDVLKIYDTSDPDWTLVSLGPEYGFAPANYIESLDEEVDEEEEEEEDAPPIPQRPQISQPAAQHESEAAYDDGQPRNPAAALAGIMAYKPSPALRQPQFTPEASDDEPPPPMPQRPQSQQLSPPQTQYASPTLQSPEPTGIQASTSRGRGQSMATSEDAVSPSGYHIYNIHEMISHMGKNKKMPTTLGINVARGVIMIAPEKARDGTEQEWTAEKLMHYSLEGKHVFIELVRPSKSIDFHAGAKQTAEEIVSTLGELAGASRAEGLKEVLAAGSGKAGQKKGHMLYEFMAQGEDEVTVAENDEVIVLDDSKSDEWWMVRRLKNGKEGVVPRQYVEVTGIIEPPSDPGLAQARSTVEQNRLEEERLTREALEASERERRKKRQSRADKSGSDSKSKPNPSNVREWTDRTGTFRVEAEFLGLKEGKIHMHKVNGVKIAVAISRMSIEDIEYVERMTGQSLDDDKPLSDIKRRSTERRSKHQSTSPRPQNGAAFETTKPKYGWFDFFLQCGVNPQICERYAQAFDRDQMGQENLPDIQPTILRTLGLKEGDILRVMKHLDEKFGRQRSTQNEAAESSSSGGIFSGPNGVLRNNTGKARPSPAVANTDTVDPRAFEQSALKKDPSPGPSPAAASPPPPALKAPTQRPKGTGFDDDAWDVKPSTQPQEPPPPQQQQQQSQLEPAARSAPPQVAAPAPQKPAPTGALAELSLLSPPLQPQPAPQQPAQSNPPATMTANVAPQQAQQAPLQPTRTGADPAFFDQLAAAQPSSQPPIQSQQMSAARQRPAPPLQTQSSFLPAPPPNRAASAPQNQQPSAFGPPPLQPQMTGFQSQPAPLGQSLSDLNQQRLQQQFTPQQPMMPMQTGVGYGGPLQNQFQMQPQTTGYPQQPQPSIPQHFAQQQFIHPQQTGTPFADPPRAPFQPGGYPNQPPQQTGGLPPPLAPQPTGMGFGGFGPQPNGFAQTSQQQQQQQPPPPVPSIPAMPQQQTPAPILTPQKTGPAPPIRFGLNNTQKPLAAQPTGKANLANATPSNPFGF